MKSLGKGLKIDSRACYNLRGLMAEMGRNASGNPNKNSFHHETSYQQTLRDNKLTPITAHRWQPMIGRKGAPFLGDKKATNLKGQDVTKRHFSFKTGFWQLTQKF